HPSEQNLPRISLPIRVSFQVLTLFRGFVHPTMIAPMKAAFRSRETGPLGQNRATPLCYPSSEQIGGMKANWLRWLCGALLAALLCGGVPASLFAQQSVSGAAPVDQTTLIITEFRVVTTDGQVLRVTGRPISLEIGKPLDSAQVAASLKAL